ncbi:MAG: MerR family transcriptional regulator [Myxococcota bacterium]
MSDGGHFSTAEVARLAGVSVATVQRFVARGAVQPARVHRAHRFGWQDVAALRSWTKLRDGSPARVAAALDHVRRRDGAHVRPAHGRLAVQDRAGVYEPWSGQQVLCFEEEAAPALALRTPAPRAKQAARDATARGEMAEALEHWQTHLAEYEDDGEGWLACGRLHHLRNALAEAQACYRAAVRHATGTTCAAAWFSLGVVLEDAGDDADARAAYESALERDATLADAHFNAARVCERLGDRWCALRHLHAYRRMRR